MAENSERGKTPKGLGQAQTLPIGPAGDKRLDPEIAARGQAGRITGGAPVGTDRAARGDGGALMDHHRDRDLQDEESAATGGSQDGGHSAQGGKLVPD